MPPKQVATRFWTTGVEWLPGIHAGLRVDEQDGYWHIDVYECLQSHLTSNSTRPPCTSHWQFLYSTARYRSQQ
ncbi:hypothetical protein PLICRDRAFT_42211 [Plicaturopsis crispa FD-325 SS-3]|nr:hypothetical protein PLICRDRAFT_42211 [Plicaturopsis crispa FD-325 SS-3]